jgi:hypothetical protein
MAAYTFARWLKKLSGLTPYEYIEDMDVRVRPVHCRSNPPDAGLNI